jgi:hypothetical protein
MRRVPFGALIWTGSIFVKYLTGTDVNEINEVLITESLFVEGGTE